MTAAKRKASNMLHCRIGSSEIRHRRPAAHLRLHCRIGSSEIARVDHKTLPLNDEALQILMRQVGKHPQRVFTFRGKPINSANTKAWQAARKRAGIEGFRWHDLRHTWATWQRQAGTPTHELQRLGGWRTGSMVERYAHLAPDQLAVAASRLDSVLGVCGEVIDLAQRISSP